MAQNGTIAYVTQLPKCDFPHVFRYALPEEKPDAQYDFKTKAGPWGFGCEDHYKQERFYPELGTGKGQKLEVRP